MTTIFNTTLEVNTSDTDAPQCLWDAALLDPPWKGQGGEPHYETLSITELSTLKPALDALLKPDAWIFMWTVKSLIEPSKDLMAQLGFTFHDFIVWTKPNRYGYGNPRIGIRRATEYLLVGSRGNVRSDFRAQQDFFSHKAGIHAEKPLVQHEIVQRMIGPTGCTLELFARTRYEDPDRPEGTASRWGFWGQELEHCDVSLLPWGWPVPADFLTTDAHQNNSPPIPSTPMPPKE